LSAAPAVIGIAAAPLDGPEQEAALPVQQEVQRISGL
jgi:hypothetical protein